MQFRTETFNGVNSFLNAINSRETNPRWGSCSSQKRGDGGWYGTSSYGAALDLARSGYVDVVGKLSELERGATCKLKQRIKSRACHPVNAYVGGSPNVCRAMLGIPRDMRSMDRKPCKARGITLVYDCGASCSVKAHELINSGAHMLALVRLLERDGVPVRLVWSWYTVDGGDVYGVNVTLKDFGGKINLAKIAYFLAHPSALRRLGFRWLETSPEVPRRIDGYGAPARFALDEIKAHHAEQGRRMIAQNELTSINDVINTYNSLQTA